MQVQPEGQGSFHIEHGHDPTQLQTRVNLQTRLPTPTQTVMAIMIWAGTFALIAATAWAGRARNVKLRPFWDCSPCPEDLHPIGKRSCPRMCVAKSLVDDIKRANCVNGPYAELKLAAIGPMTEWTQSLVHHVTNQSWTGGQEALLARRLSRDNMEVAAFELLGRSTAVEHKSVMQLLASPQFLPVLLPIILVVATAWFAILRSHPAGAMLATAIAFVLGLLYGYTLFSNWVMLAVAAAFSAYMAACYKSISAGCSCLQGGLTALAYSPMSLAVIVATCVCLMVHTALLVALLVFTNQVYHVHRDEFGNCELQRISSGFCAIFTVLFLLFANFFTMVSNYCIAFAIGCWYFHHPFSGDTRAPAVPMVTGLKMAIFSRNGTGICAEAAVLMTTFDYIKHKTSRCPNFTDPLWLLLAVVHSCFRSYFESLCSFALMAVAIEGGGLRATSQLAKDTIGAERCRRFLVIKTSLGWLLDMQAHALATALGMISFGVMDAVENVGFFKSLADDIRTARSPKEAQLLISFIVIVFFWLMRKPLFTLSIVIMTCVWGIPEMIQSIGFNCFLASLLVGSIGSLTFHQFSEAAAASLGAMLYCWSLDEAMHPEGEQAGHDQCREQAKLLMAQAAAVTPSPIQALTGLAPAEAPARQVGSA